jgi:hypothetical protein
MGSDRKDGPGLRKAMCAGKSSFQNSGAELSELAIRVPPSREVHLAEPGHQDAQLK